MSSAHIFYLPVFILIGVALGYVLGRRSAELDAQQRDAKQRRRDALRRRAQDDNPSPAPGQDSAASPS